MIKHNLLLDTVSFKSKPTNSEIRAINNRIINHPTEIDIVEFSKQITAPYSRTWISAHLKGSRKNESWQSQSIFALDFDKGITFEEVLNRLREYELDCTFAYSTFSDGVEKPKFRVVWQLDYVVTDRSNRDEIQLALMTLFPEADKACKDASRIFFGGTKLIYTNYDYYLNIPALLESAQFHAVRNSSTQNMSRDLKRVRKKLGLCENGSEKHTAYINTIGTAVFASKMYDSSDKSSPIETIRGVDFEELRKEIKILDDLMNPDIKLLHPQLLGLAKNLRYIEGGQALYEQCITKNPDYAQEEKLKIMNYCKSCNYLPMSLENFSPYKEDWEYGNLLNAAKKKKITRLNRRETMWVEQSRQKLQDESMSILKSEDTNIHVFKGVTGIGKTKIVESSENVLIALPYHSLKDEIAKDRMKVPFKETPSLDTLPSEVRDSLNYYYSIGAFSWASKYLSDMSKIYESVKHYQSACSACYDSEETVLTTHQKAIFIPCWTHKTIIFDEDILSSLMPISKVTMNDLLRLEASINNSSDKRVLTSLINDIREGRVNTPREMDMSVFEDFGAIEDEVLGSKTKYESNILHFFNARYFVLDSRDSATIHYINKYELPKDKKIIVLSATVDETMYRYLFGDRLKFYDMSNVEPLGLIEQDTKYSFSQSTFLGHSDYAIERVGDLPVITFAKFKSVFPNPIQEMHFGYCSGLDKYNGQDIAVVGTPHVSPITIALYAKALGLPVKTHEFSKVRQQPVYHNGFRFWFNTYDNEYLRSIQFYFIETGLKQAIGRARPYTTTSTVKVFSNYPLPEAAIGKKEQTLGREKLERNLRTHLEQCLAASSNSEEQKVA